MSKGLYLYCIVNKRSEKSFGFIGFQEQKIYLVPYRNISVVAQSCFVKELRQMSKADLAISHQFVMDFMMKKFNEVIPFNLGIIVENKKNLNKLLLLKYKKIKSELEEKKDKREYGIQIFYLPVYLQEKPSISTTVTAFILQQQQNRVLLMQKEAEYKNILLNEIKELVEEIKINPSFGSSINEQKDKRILLNLNCLVNKDNVKKLEETLAEINNRKEFSVNFNGPWAPYSFTKIFEE